MVGTISRQRVNQILNPEKHAARTAVTKMIELGWMPKASELRCVDCGGQAKEWDHHLGYSEECRLAVLPRCQRCHAQRPKVRWDTAARLGAEYSLWAECAGGCGKKRRPTGADSQPRRLDGKQIRDVNGGTKKAPCGCRCHTTEAV